MKTQKEYDVTFIQLSIQHEEAMAMLYDTFRIQVPCCEGFWKCICNEEMGHSQRLEVLSKEIKAGNAALAPERHNSSLIEASLTSLRERTKVWRQSGVDTKDAFEYALLLEGGIIEDRVFAPQDDDSELTQQILWEMRSGTSNHFHRIKKEYEKHSFSAGFLTHLAASFKSLLSLSDEPPNSKK